MPDLRCAETGNKRKRQLAWAMDLIVSAQKRNWHGDLVIKFEAGLMKLGSKSVTSLKPPS